MPEEINPDMTRADSEERRAEPLHYDFGSPMKTDVLDDHMEEDVEFLYDGPN